MRHHSLRVLFLSSFLGLIAGSGLLPLSSIQLAVQAAELSSQGFQDGVIKACTGQSINLGAPQLTEADLKVLTGCSSGVIPQLLEALKSRDWKVKVIAAHTLGLFGKQAQSVIPELSSLMQDENADVRFAVAQALGDIGTEAVVPVLTKALQDKDENVRVSAADAFLRIGAVAKPAKPVLIAALWDGNWYVRNRAATTISKLGLSTSDIPALVAPLKDTLEPDNGEIISLMNGEIISLMLSIYPPVFNKIEDLPLFFIEGLRNEDPIVRENSAIGLRLAFVGGSRSYNKVRLRESIYALEKAVKDRDSKVQLSALRILRALRNEKEVMKDPDFRIRVNEPPALRSIEKIISNEGLKSESPPKKLDAIVALYKICGNRDRDEAKCLGASKLVLPLLINTLKENVKPLRYAAALMIVYIEPKEESGISILKEILLNETNYNLRETAKNALQKIGSYDALSGSVSDLL